MVLVKLNAQGGHLWSKGFGAQPAALIVDPAGSVVVAGSYKSEVDFGTGALRSRGDGDGWLARFAP